MSMNNESIKVNDTSQSLQINDNVETIFERFKNFRRDVDLREKNLSESKTLIEQLKDEIKISREVEKNLREQVISSQNRSIQLQTFLNKLTVVSEQQRKNETASKTLEKSIEELYTMICTAQDSIKNIHGHALVSVDLLKQNDELKTSLKTKESQLNLLKINIQSLIKEKSEIMLKFETKIKELEEDLQKSKLEFMEMKNQNDRSILMYKKEIKERESMLKEYERERKGLLEDFDTFKKPDKIFTSADSTVSLNIDERGETEENQSTLREERDAGLFLCTTNTQVEGFKTNTKFKKKETCKKSSKQRVEIEFVSQSQPESEVNVNSCQPPIKRRLFSTNCNHYFN